jgi:hypothetical protein
MGDWFSLFVDAALDVLAAAALAAINWVLDLLSATVFTSPDVTVLPQVRQVAGNAQFAANACMGLAVMVVGVMTMTHGSLQDRYALKDLLPRLFVGFVAANLSTPMVSTCIETANAVTAALTADRYSSAESFGQIRRVLAGVPGDQSVALVVAGTQVLALIVLLLLLATWIGRIGILLVAAGVAPLALACHALPQTDLVARLWWRAVLACLGVQVLQAVTLHVAVATLLSPQANLPALGFPHDPSGLLNLLIVTYVLWLVMQVPRWVARTVSGGRPGRAAGLLGSVIRVVVVQQVWRAIGGSRRGGGQPRSPRGTHRGAPPVHPRQPAGVAVAAHRHTGTPTRPSPAAVAPSVTPPGAIPLRRARWQAHPSRPSGTGWPSAPQTEAGAGRRSGTGWPADAPGYRRGGRRVR